MIAGRPSYDAGSGSASGSAAVNLIRVRSTGFSRSGMAGRALNYVSYLLVATWKARSLDRHDVVLSFTDPPFLGVGAVFVARRHKAKLVQVFYDVYPDVAVALGTMTDGAVAAAWRRVNGATRRRCDKIVVIGRDMRDRLIAQGVPAAKIEVISNWADPNEETADAVARTRRELGWDGRTVILHAGNVGLGHNLTAFVEAAASMPASSDVRFVIMGEGAAKPGLQEMVAARHIDNVEFIGYQPKERAQRIIAAADHHLVSLAPGLAGAMVPSKVYGIMAAGRPFIAAVEAASEVGLLIEEIGCGIRCEPTGPAAIVEVIERLRAGDAEEMGRQGRAAFARSFTRQIATSAYGQLLRAQLPDA